MGLPKTDKQQMPKRNFITCWEKVFLVLEMDNLINIFHSNYKNIKSILFISGQD